MVKVLGKAWNWLKTDWCKASWRDAGFVLFLILLIVIAWHYVADYVPGILAKNKNNMAGLFEFLATKLRLALIYPLLLGIVSLGLWFSRSIQIKALAVILFLAWGFYCLVFPEQYTSIRKSYAILEKTSLSSDSRTQALLFKMTEDFTVIVKKPNGEQWISYEGTTAEDCGIVCNEVSDLRWVNAETFQLQCVKFQGKKKLQKGDAKGSKEASLLTVKVHDEPNNNTHKAEKAKINKEKDKKVRKAKREKLRKEWNQQFCRYYKSEVKAQVSIPAIVE